MAVNITPLHDRVLVRRLEGKEAVKGGIIIPDTAKEKPQEGEVIAVGNGRREKGELIPLDVKPGDRILFGKYSGNDITIDDEEYMILKEDEILAKIGGSAKSNFNQPRFQASSRHQRFAKAAGGNSNENLTEKRKRRKETWQSKS
jgi:chaperonin GroES